MGRMGLGVDDTIKFVESTHQYFDKSGNEFESVTRSLKKLQMPFDRDGISRRMASAMASEQGISIAQAQAKILSEWDQKRDSSIDRGTSIHGSLEQYLLKGTIAEEYRGVIEELKKIVAGAYRYYPEIILYDERYRRAGQADLVVQRQKGSSSIYDFYDYKTNEAKGIQFDSIGRKTDELKHYNRFFLPPFNYLEDCNYNLYSLQLNFYAYFAVRTYGIKVGRLGIIFIDNQLKVHLIPVMFAPSIIKDILSHLEKMKKLPKPKDNW
jgi:hypothetical protein